VLVSASASAVAIPRVRHATIGGRDFASAATSLWNSITECLMSLVGSQLHTFRPKPDCVYSQRETCHKDITTTSDLITGSHVCFIICVFEHYNVHHGPLSLGRGVHNSAPPSPQTKYTAWIPLTQWTHCSPDVVTSRVSELFPQFIAERSIVVGPQR